MMKSKISLLPLSWRRIKSSDVIPQGALAPLGYNLKGFKIDGADNMENKIGNMQFADTLKVIIENENVFLWVELNGRRFDAKDYPNKKVWLQDIINWTYDCAVRKAN